MHQADTSLLSALLANERTAPSTRRLSEAESLSVFTLSAYLEAERPWDGPALHQVLGEWLCTGLSGQTALKGWLQSRFSSKPFRPARFASAEKRALQVLQAGFFAVEPKGDIPGSIAPGPSPCPRVLFARGDFPPGPPWVTIFNSRKSRLPNPHAEWLEALRTALASISGTGGMLAGSLGTLTYDLAAAYALHHRSRLLLVLPSPVEELLPESFSLPFQESAQPDLTMTCLTGATGCPKATRARCRDRILAFLADVHFVIEIRSNGNMLRVLQDQQNSSPRRQAIFQPERLGSWNVGNLRLQAAFHQYAVPFSAGRPADAPSPTAPAAPAARPGKNSGEIPWSEYLYHYTRSCPGPWPGQPYGEFLLDLLAAGLLSGHTSLDTLVRIVSEERIRACGQLVRGGHAAVSLTSLPPMRLESIRRWNPALIRWTFEPYGVAISRKLLREEGAKPAIYAHASRYPDIGYSERYRFQMHRPPWSSWKYEREWRFRRDIDLGRLGGHDAFVFVPSTEDAEKLQELTGCRFPVIIVPAEPCAGKP
ncbi:MAG: hypothetical protein LLF99_18745 [Desulfobacteraceae bacterium]|nr:hypothetical protein [Desulfobacteraceae bacterium]